MRKLLTTIFMDPQAEQALEEVDSYLLSSDAFFSKEALKKLQSYLDRWNRQAKELENIVAEESK